MENAIKALLIAAAVLIVIIIVAVGMKIYTSASGTGKVTTYIGTTINDKTKSATDIAISEITERGIVKVITKDNYGDYIDLGTNILSNEPADWRILYNDKSGHVYAILADYLPVNATGIKELVISSGLQIIKGRTYNVTSDSRDNLINSLKNQTAWNKLIPKSLTNKGIVVNGATTRKIINDSYKEKTGKELQGSTDPNNPSNTDTLYYPRTNNSNGTGYKWCYGYWLASASASTSNKSLTLCIHCNGCVNAVAYYGDAYGVRPIVIIPARIQVTKKGEIWEVVQ